MFYSLETVCLVKKKVKVDQLEKNNVKSAINGDDISAYIEVVVSSSRALTSGETVRVVR